VNIPASSTTSSRFLGKKRNKTASKTGKSVIDEVEDVNINIEYNLNDYLKPGDQPQLYCICNGVSEGDMVACDNPRVRILFKPLV
jgi:hypothetical protein